MDKRLAQFSIVVVAAAHNPTIMNPDFLKTQKIVGEDWELAEPPLTSLPFSSVQFTNGISITVEQNKLQIADSQSNDPSQSIIADVVKKYILVVPHVKYTAVGINFNAFVEFENPENYIISKFLKDGPWNESPNLVSELGLKFVYSVHDGRLILSLNTGSAKKNTADGEEEKSILMASGNFHRDIVAEKDKHLSDHVINFLNYIESDWDKFDEIFSTLLT